jgi:nucleoid DNA-binding protein
MAVTQAQFESELLKNLTREGFDFTKQDVRDILQMTGDTVEGLLKIELDVHTKVARAAKRDKNGSQRVPNPAVIVRGVGRFTVRSYPARIGRNPQTGESMKIKASKKLGIKAPKPLRDALGVK